jgi:pimeloyl-ACP methyl ester carboxylesterase
VKAIPPSVVCMPSYFIAGVDDMVLTMDPGGVDRMRNTLPDLRGAVLIPGAGHWVQQETPEQFNDALLGFLATL